MSYLFRQSQNWNLLRSYLYISGKRETEMLHSIEFKNWKEIVGFHGLE